MHERCFLELRIFYEGCSEMCPEMFEPLFCGSEKFPLNSRQISRQISLRKIKENHRRASAGAQGEKYYITSRYFSEFITFGVMSLFGTCFCCCYCDPRGVCSPQFFTIDLVVKYDIDSQFSGWFSPQSWQTFARASPPKCFEDFGADWSSSAEQPKHPKNIALRVVSNES